MPSRGATIGMVAGTAVVVGASIYYLFGRNSVRETDDDDAFNAHAMPASNAAGGVKSGFVPAAEKSNQSEKVVDALTSISNAEDPSSVGNKLLAEALREIGMENPMERTAMYVANAAKSAGGNRGSSQREFPLLGLSVALPSEWDIQEEIFPMPNVTMLSFWNENLSSEDAQQRPGSVPTIVFSAEDVRGDNITLEEFKDRSTELGRNQMLMMSGGAIEPVVTQDGAVREGPFRYAVEYSQSLPPFYELVVLNLFEVRCGVAYTFQMMASRDVMQEYKPVFMEMARGMSISDGVCTSLGYVELHTGALKVNADTTWAWDYPGRDGAVITFTTQSSIKKEEISLYTRDAVPITPHKTREEKTVNGVVVVSAFDGVQQKKTFTYNDYTLVVKPLQKSNSYMDEKELITVLKSVSPSTKNPKPKKGGTFVNEEHGYQMDIFSGGHLVSSRIGGGTVLYAPHGVETGEAHMPSVNIRIGSPETDPECMASIDEWEERMKQEAKESDIKYIKQTTVRGRPCLSFESQVTEDVMPGQRVDIRAKVYVFVIKGVTTLVRLEMSTGLWKKYEREMNDLLESIEFI